MSLAQDLAAAWAVIKPLINRDAVSTEIDTAIQTLDNAVNGGIDAELAKVVPAPFEPAVAAVVNEGLSLLEHTLQSKLQAVAAGKAATAA